MYWSLDQKKKKNNDKIVYNEISTVSFSKQKSLHVIGMTICGWGIFCCLRVPNTPCISGHDVTFAVLRAVHPAVAGRTTLVG